MTGESLSLQHDLETGGQLQTFCKTIKYFRYSTNFFFYILTYIIAINFCTDFKNANVRSNWDSGANDLYLGIKLSILCI